MIPISRAVSMSSDTGMTLAAFMTFFMSTGPSPPKFIFDSPSFSGPFGSIAEKAFCSTLLVACDVAAGFRRALSPQKVKNMVTSSSMATAPLAMMKAAITLS